MPEYLYKVTPTRIEMVADPTPREQEVVAEHFAWLQTQVAAGIILIVGRTQTTGAETFGITIFRAGSHKDAREFMNHDPAVINGVMNAEVFPYRVALMAGMSLDEWRAASG